MANESLANLSVYLDWIPIEELMWSSIIPVERVWVVEISVKGKYWYLVQNGTGIEMAGFRHRPSLTTSPPSDFLLSPQHSPSRAIAIYITHSVCLQHYAVYTWDPSVYIVQNVGLDICVIQLHCPPLTVHPTFHLCSFITLLLFPLLPICSHHSHILHRPQSCRPYKSRKIVLQSRLPVTQTHTSLNLPPSFSLFQHDNLLYISPSRHHHRFKLEPRAKKANIVFPPNPDQHKYHQFSTQYSQIMSRAGTTATDISKSREWEAW